MGRPPDNPRLAELKPAPVGRRAVELLQQHPAVAYEDTRAVLIDGFLSSTATHKRTETLLAWAREGHPDHKRQALECLDALEQLLFAAPLLHTGRPHGYDHSDPLQLVMAAASARKLAQAQRAVPGPDLAALAGISPVYVRRMVREGRLRRAAPVNGGRVCDAPIVNDDACELLRERGVKGFTDE
jgi:hypothetical protein